MRLLVLLTAASLLAGCGTVSCDLREGSANGAEPRCQERDAFQAIGDVFGFCTALGGERVDGTCPDPDQQVASCVLSQFAGSVTDVYYEPLSRDEAAQMCEEDDGELLD